MMATPLSMMALWNKPLAIGDKIWKENTGDSWKLSQEIPPPHIPAIPFLKSSSQKASLRALTLEGRKVLD
jgi:hypothetical protein